LEPPGNEFAREENFTVYIVDDDHAVLKALTRLVTTAGYAVKPFASAQEFFIAHDPSLPGCAVIDILMPEHDGLEVQSVLQAAGRPVVFLTGVDDTELSGEVMKAGAIDVLTKPINSERLFRAIESAAAHDRETRSPEKAR
jgi:FixJ family two-component response regulator